MLGLSKNNGCDREPAPGVPVIEGGGFLRQLFKLQAENNASS